MIFWNGLRTIETPIFISNKTVNYVTVIQRINLKEN